MRAAELYDTRRAEAPDWKPTTWKHTGDCFPLDDLPALPRRGGSRYGSQAGTPKAARMQRQGGSQSLPSLPAAQTRSHGYPGPHQSLSPKHARGGFLPQVGPNLGTTPTQIIRECLGHAGERAGLLWKTIKILIDIIKRSMFMPVSNMCYS